MKRFLQHLVATAIFACVASGVVAVLYLVLVVASVVSTGDFGGPLNFVLVPAFGFLLGSVLALALYLPVGLLYRARRITLKRTSLIAVAFSALAALVMLAFGPPMSGAVSVVVSVVVAAVVGLGFAGYLSIVLALGTIANRLGWSDGV